MCKQQPKVLEIAEAFKENIAKEELTPLEVNFLMDFIKRPIEEIQEFYEKVFSKAELLQAMFESSEFPTIHKAYVDSNKQISFGKHWKTIVITVPLLINKAECKVDINYDYLGREYINESYIVFFCCTPDKWSNIYKKLKKQLNVDKHIQEHISYYILNNDNVIDIVEETRTYLQKLESCFAKPEKK